MRHATALVAHEPESATVRIGSVVNMNLDVNVVVNDLRCPIAGARDSNPHWRETTHQPQAV